MGRRSLLQSSVNGRIGMRSQASGIVGALVLGLCLVSPRPVAGDIFTQNWGGLICGGEATFSFCTSVSVTFNSGTGQIQMSVQNLTGPGLGDPELTKIAFYNTGSPFTTVGALSGGLSSGWVSTDKPNSSGGQKPDFGVQTKSGINGAIPRVGLGGSTFSFNFYLEGGTATGLGNFGTALQAGEVGLSIHAQSGPGGTSSTCLTLGKNANCDTSTVPEPGTFILLGTGLAGIAFVGRRRRKALEED